MANTDNDFATILQALTERAAQETSKRDASETGKALDKLAEKLDAAIKNNTNDPSKVEAKFFSQFEDFKKKHDKEYNILVKDDKLKKVILKNDKAADKKAENFYKVAQKALQKAEAYNKDIATNYKELQTSIDSMSKDGIMKLLEFTKQKKINEGNLRANINKGESGLFGILGKKLSTVLGNSKITNTLLAIKTKSLAQAQEEADIKAKHVQELQNKAVSVIAETDKDKQAASRESFEKLVNLEKELGNISEETHKALIEATKSATEDGFKTLSDLNKSFAKEITAELSKSLDNVSNWTEGNKLERERMVVLGTAHIEESTKLMTDTIDKAAKKSKEINDEFDVKNNYQKNNEDLIKRIMTVKSNTDLNKIYEMIDNGKFSNDDAKANTAKTEYMKLADTLKTAYENGQKISDTQKQSELDKIERLITANKEFVSTIYKGKETGKDTAAIKESQVISGNLDQLVEIITKSNKQLSDSHLVLNNIKKDTGSILTLLTSMENMQKDASLEANSKPQEKTAGTVINNTQKAAEVKSDKSKSSSGLFSMLGDLIMKHGGKMLMGMFAILGRLIMNPRLFLRVIQMILTRSVPALLTGTVGTILATIGLAIGTFFAAFKLTDMFLKATGMDQFIEKIAGIWYDLNEWIYNKIKGLAAKLGFDNSKGTEFARSQIDSGVVVDTLGNGSWEIVDEKVSKMNSGQLMTLASSDKFDKETKQRLINMAKARQPKPSVGNTNNVVNTANVEKPVTPADIAAAVTSSKGNSTVSTDNSTVQTNSNNTVVNNNPSQLIPSFVGRNKGLE